MRTSAVMVAGVALALLFVSRRAEAGIVQELGIKSGAFRVPQEYAAMLTGMERRHNLPAGLLGRVAWQESRFRPDIISGAVRSRVGALGMFQFMPATAAELGVDPLNPVSAADGAARYLAALHARFGSWKKALAAYNWGQGNLVRKDLNDGVFGDDLPEETRLYVAQIAADVPGIA